MTDNAKTKKTLFSFRKGGRNINGRYLQSTYVKESGTALWIFCGIIFLLLIALYIEVLVNWQEFTFERMWPTASHTGGLYGRMAAFLAIPIGLVTVILLPPFLLMVIFMLFPEGKGWTARNNFFATWFGKWRRKQKGWHHASALFYFNTTERHSMPIDVYNNKIVVYLAGGVAEVPYTQMYKLIESQDLCVIRALRNDSPWDIIIDLRELEDQIQKDFMEFIKSKKEKFIDADTIHEPWARKGQKFN